MRQLSLTSLYHLHEPGRKRNQEDYTWPAPGTSSSPAFIVCDGVGGSDNGEVASRVIAQSVGNALLRADQPVSREYVFGLLNTAKDELVAHARSNALNTDMATTFALLAVQDEKAFIAWCGDSRVYHIRNGRILFCTEDHSLVSALVKNGDITEEEARRHPGRNMILKAVKADGSPVEPDSHWIEDVREDDYFLLCTDGLLENITNKDLAYLLSDQNTSPEKTGDTIAQKCRGNTNDNYSMYLLQASFTMQQTAHKKKKLTPAILLLAVCLLAVTFFIFYTGNTNSAPLGDHAKEVKDTVTKDSLREFKITSSPAVQAPEISKADSTGMLMESSDKKPLN